MQASPTSGPAGPPSPRPASDWAHRGNSTSSSAPTPWSASSTPGTPPRACCGCARRSTIVTDGYDVTIIDPRPSANALTLGALRAAAHVVLVAEPRLAATQGITRLSGADAQARWLDRNPPERDDGVVVNLVEGGRRRLDRHRTRELREHFGDRLWAEFPRRAEAAEAAERHLPAAAPSAARESRRWADGLLPVVERILP